MKNGPYELVIAPENYPGKKYRGKYVYLHRLLWWEKTGEILDYRTVIHHKNENKIDNSLENLEKKSRQEHSKEHQIPASKTNLTCHKCKKEFEVKFYEYNYKIKTGQTKFYCSRSCQVSATHDSRRSELREPEHGIYKKYAQGCRCDLCKASNAKRARERRAKRKLNKK